MPIQVYIIAGLLIAAGVGGAFYWTWDTGRDAGTAAVRTEVMSTTIETMGKAREAKERADSEVRSMPYGEKVDGLR